MCPAGLQPAASNASRCGEAPAGYSTKLYAAVGSVIGAGILFSVGIMLVMRRRSRSFADKSCAGVEPGVSSSYKKDPLNGQGVLALTHKHTLA
jgi:hypothetical protein